MHKGLRCADGIAPRLILRSHRHPLLLAQPLPFGSPRIFARSGGLFPCRSYSLGFEVVSGQPGVVDLQDNPRVVDGGIQDLQSHNYSESEEDGNGLKQGGCELCGSRRELQAEP